MRRRIPACSVLLAAAAALLAGCHPQQPFYLLEDGDLSHYVGTATDLESPDICDSGLEEVANPDAPRSLANAGGHEVWKLRLEQAMSLALANSKVFRTLGGRIVPGASPGAPETIMRNPDAIASVYLPAIQETVPGGSTEWALGAFDAQWSTGVFWEKNSSPRNNLVGGGLGSFFANTFEQDLGTFQSQIAKTSASGLQTIFRNQTRYEQNNIPSREVPSDWSTLFDVELRQPLLARGGVNFNRIAGPEGQPGNFNGVMISRIRTDIRLADFEAATRNLVNDVEQAYWNLYFAYRNLDASRAGRNSALATWQKVYANYIAGRTEGSAEALAQAGEQYYLFRKQMEDALTALYDAESTLRYIMGLAATDSRLIKPADEPVTAPVTFDWQDIHAEALGRSVELRQQRWRIQQRELELVAAKNLVLPSLDAVARYRWEGLGDDLLSSNRSGSSSLTGSNAFETLTGGDFQSWQWGLNFNMALGRRRELLTVQHHELLLARERAVLEESELEVSHQMAEAVRRLEGLQKTTQTAFNRRVTAQQQVQAVEAQYEVGRATLDLVLDAQRRLADADIEYYRTLVSYNLAITNVHFRKNSLLEYNGVHLAEGPWPGKAYFDAHRRARQRDASIYLNYGMTQPAVVSQGPISQGTGDATLEEVPTAADPHDEHELLPPPEAPGTNGESHGDSADEEPAPLPTTPASRRARPAAYTSAPVGPKSDGRPRTLATGRIVGGNEGGVRHAAGTANTPNVLRAKKPSAAAKSSPSTKTGKSTKSGKFDWGELNLDETDGAAAEPRDRRPREAPSPARKALSQNVLRGGQADSSES